MHRKTDINPIKLRKLRVQELCVKYYIEGRTYAEVIEKLREDKLTVSSSTISKYIKQAIEGWRKDQNELITDYKSIELAKINKIEVEAWEAWDRSKAAQETINYKSEAGKGRAKTKRTETGVSARTSPGESKFLLITQWCVDKRLELMAGIAPSEIVANQTGEKMTVTQTTTRQIIFKTRNTSTGASMTSAEEIITEEKKIEKD